MRPVAQRCPACGVGAATVLVAYPGEPGESTTAEEVCVPCVMRTQGEVKGTRPVMREPHGYADND